LHQWALGSGVTLIALPDAPLDPWSVREATLLSASQPWLDPVWSDPHWRVWRVIDGVGMVSGPAQLTWLGVNSASLHFDHAGTVVVKVRWSTYWQVTAGTACLSASPQGWLSVDKDRPGDVSLAALWSLSRMTGLDNGCAASDGPAR
jgi:hypothetical protein